MHLTIYKINESYVKIQCEDSIAWELRDAFAYRPQGFQYMPTYRNKIWDGWIRMFDVRTRQILKGMIPRIKEWANERGYTWEYVNEPLDENISLHEVEEFIKTLNPKHPPRDYQVDGFVHGLRKKNMIIISPTGSGKSLLQYLFMMYLLKQGKRGLLIVPRTNLVEQMYSDFEDYSCNNGKDMSKYCHRIYQGKEKHTNLPLVISTWQSLQNLPPQWFLQFDYVIVDEVHQAVENKQSQKVLTKIVTNCKNADYKIGVTGTIPDDPSAKLSLQALFGDVYKVITSAELMARKQLAELNIKCLLLKYSDEECQYMKSASYKDEIDYIISHKSRNNFIVNLTLSLKGNTLLLFNFVEKHGKILYDMICDKLKEDNTRKVFFIHGGTNIDEREQIRRIVETESDAIIVGSVGVLSTGTNIVSLSNIVFASPSKSKIRNLQAIGRALRVGTGKESATLFDIADSFVWRKRQNYTLQHFFERIKIYNKEKFQFKIYQIKVK